MIRKHLHGALFLAAVSLLATSAVAQSPQASPQGKANSADKADKKEGKAEGKADKKDDKAEAKADKKDDKEADKAKSADERAARKTKQHDAQREKLKAILKGAPDDAIKQELRRHAERLARLERIKAVALTEKDNSSVEKATMLIVKENDRHDKWIGKHAVTAAVDTKGGAK